MRPKGLKQLRRACLAAAQAETSSYPDYYDPKGRGRLDGHCGVVALMIRGCFGGDVVKGLVNGHRHYWNRLPDGTEIDLTSCQFGGDGITPLKRGRRVGSEQDKPLCLAAVVFAMRVMARLRQVPA